MMIKELKSNEKECSSESLEEIPLNMMFHVLSATTVIKNMDTEKYNVILVGITKEGKWLLVDGVKDIEDGSWREGEVKAFISPDTTTRSLVILAEGTYKLQKVDVIFPVLHGMYQGFLYP